MKDAKTILKREIVTPGELRVREKGEGEESGRTIEGYAILFDTPSGSLYEDEERVIREIIDRSAVTQELLDSSDIKFTMFHDRKLLLARSKKGSGSLSYKLDEKGVAFSFEAPHTPDGDKALELIRTGIIDGCSFAFSTRYYDGDCVERTVKNVNGRAETTCRVKVILDLYDMTITPDPAYPLTEVAVRELVEEEKAEPEPEPEDLRSYFREKRRGLR